LVLAVFSSPKMASRKAPASNEVSRPAYFHRDAGVCLPDDYGETQGTFPGRWGWPLFYNVCHRKGKRFPSFRP